MNKLSHFKNLIYNKSYQQLKPVYTQKEHLLLSEDIRKRGCIEPIVIWKQTILDGYKRYDICKRAGITYKVKCLEFRTDEEALAWVCRNELQNPLLSESYQKYNLGKLYHAQKVILSTQYPHMRYGTSRPEIIFTTKTRNYTATLIGQEYGVCFSTVYKYGIFSDDIDKIFKKSPEIAITILSNRIHVSHNAVSALASMTTADLAKIKRYCLSEEDTFKIHMDDIERVINSGYKFAKQMPKQIQPEIKQVPKYDPDAEISSLALTMPSWTTSILRTCSTAPFELVSEDARNNICQHVWELKDSISCLEKKLGGVKHD